jgi:methylenetetrahydrofolate--tRNA-(uracil-5-)-methyltransferase
LYNLVGFQTNLRWAEQKRVFSLIPGLENAEYARYGQMHRNTFINSPVHLNPTLQYRLRSDLFFAGQITGVEGYAGNIGTGLLAGINVAHCVLHNPLWELPPTTMLGGLCYYITHADPSGFQPMKANLGILPALADPARNKRERQRAYAERAQADLESFLIAHET